MITRNTFIMGVFVSFIPMALHSQCEGSWTAGPTLDYLCANGPFLQFETGDCPSSAQSTFTFSAPVQSVKLAFSAFGTLVEPGDSRLSVFLNGNKIDLANACKIVLGCQTPAGDYSLEDGCLVDNVSGLDGGISGGIYLIASAFDLASITSIGVAVSEPSLTGTIFEVDSCNESFGCQTGVMNFAQSAKTIYPNPFTDNLTVNYTGDETAEVIIYDMTLRVVVDNTFQKSLVLSTGNLEKGVYIYAVKINGIITEMGKIVKSE